MREIFIYILISCIFYVMIDCLIPDLSVRRVDKNFIAKKRQDTIDLCRMFTEESRNDRQNSIHIVPSYKNNNRIKRDLKNTFSINPALNEEDANRVEEIVDKLYEDEADVTLRPETKKTNSPKPSRRFDFKPALLLGPLQRYNTTSTTEDPGNFYMEFDRTSARWKHGIVPYFIDPKTYDAQLSEAIIAAFDYVEKATCIRLQKLREKPTDKKSMKDVGWIYITNPTGIKQCVHSNENRLLEGVQMVVFGYNCMNKGDIVHEVMHILGFSHEHLRSDRDQYISILWDNIKPGYRKYFDITMASGTQYKLLRTLPYDYASILHYPARAFSKNGKHTILTKNGIKIGQREGLSEIDIEKVGLIYSGECIDRNKEYLQKTCPTVVKADIRPTNVSQEEIDDYFRHRIWPLGIVYYKFKDDLEFSAEEKENIRAVFEHIEKETCIKFQVHDVEDNNNDAFTEHNNEYQGPEINNPFLDVYGRNYTPPKIIVISGDKPKLNNISPTDESDSANEISSGADPMNEIINTKGNVRTGSANRKIAEKPVKRQRAALGPQKKKTSRKLKKTNKKFDATRRHFYKSKIVLGRTTTPGCKCPTGDRIEGHQLLELSEDCFNSVNDLLHFFVHVLGLDHQHNMHDRDSYLHIIWENLTPEVREEMSKKLPPAASLGFAYDYQSVMHYPWLEIKNGVTNIMYPVWNDGWAMGHWQGLSSTDVQKLNILYFEQCSLRKQMEEGNEGKQIQLRDL